MDKWNLIIDVAECHNCHNCVVAAKDELVGNDFPGYSASHPAQGPGVIRIERHVRGSGHHLDTAYLPRLCQHCDDAPCVKAGGGAVKKRADGIVVFDPEACRGRRDLVDVCPHGAVLWNEERQLPQTWFFDAHLLDAGWREPRCVTVCPTRALQAVKLDDAAMAERARAEGLRTLRPGTDTGTDTRPRVYYRHLARTDSVFVAGSLVDGASADCLADADVELRRDGTAVAHARSDAFGDFRFDGLAPRTGACLLVIRPAGRGTVERPLRIGDHSVVLDDIDVPR
jgi:Fe-S-cluster-containing dehydrogenase component